MVVLQDNDISDGPGVHKKKYRLECRKWNAKALKSQSGAACTVVESISGQIMQNRILSDTARRKLPE